MSKGLKLAAIFSSFMIAGCCYAQSIHTNNLFSKYFDVSGSATLASNYIWRGVSQTDNAPAAQASMDLNSKMGVYLGFWGSNVNFSDSVADTATSELDLYVGYKNSFKHIDYDIGFLRYIYPRTTRIDWNEPYLKLGYKWFSIGIHYSPNYSMLNEHSFYYNVGAHYTFPTTKIKDLTVGASIGRSTISGTLSDLSYTDYRIYASKNLTKHLSLSVEWTNTNANPSTNLNDSHFAGSLSLSL